MSIKKPVIATVAMIAAGSFAAAEGVSVSGSGGMGVRFDELSSSSSSGEISFVHDFDIKFSASSVTDGGLEFGASMEINNNEGITSTLSAVDYVGEIELTYPGDQSDVVLTDAQLAKLNKAIQERCEEGNFSGVDKNIIEGLAGVDANSTSISGWDYTCTSRASYASTVDNLATVYVSGAFGKISMGDITAGDVVGGISDVGYTGLGVDDIAESLDGNSKKGVRYEGTFGPVTIQASLDGDEDWAAGVKVAMADFSGGLGFDSNEVLSAALGYSAGAITGNLIFSTVSALDTSTFGAEIIFDAGPASVSAAYSQLQDGGRRAASAFGTGVAYPLGGGATLKAGIASKEANGNRTASGDIGISMAF